MGYTTKGSDKKSSFVYTFSYITHGKFKMKREPKTDTLYEDSVE